EITDELDGGEGQNGRLWNWERECGVRNSEYGIGEGLKVIQWRPERSPGRSSCPDGLASLHSTFRIRQFIILPTRAGVSRLGMCGNRIGVSDGQAGPPDHILDRAPPAAVSLNPRRRYPIIRAFPQLRR